MFPLLNGRFYFDGIFCLDLLMLNQKSIISKTYTQPGDVDNNQTGSKKNEALHLPATRPLWVTKGTPDAQVCTNYGNGCQHKEAADITDGVESMIWMRGRLEKLKTTLKEIQGWIHKPQHRLFFHSQDHHILILRSLCCKVHWARCKSRKSGKCSLITMKGFYVYVDRFILCWET